MPCSPTRPGRAATPAREGTRGAAWVVRGRGGGQTTLTLRLHPHTSPPPSSLRRHFTSFDLPPSLREELLTLAPPGTRPFSPAELRAYLKRKLTDPKKREKRLAHRAWAGMHSAAFCLELLDFCIGDLQGGGAKGGFANLVGLLLLPLASGGLAYVGQASRGGEPHVVATVQQQTLLPHLRSRFVSPECTAHETLGAYFLHNDEFLRAARLQSVTLSFFAQQLQPLQMQPSATYLHTVWQTMGRSAGGAIKPTPEVVELFGSKALLPLRSGQVVAVGELSSTLALPAPLLQLELDGAASHWAPQASQAADAEPAAARPRVDELMSTLAVPVVDPAFVCVDEAPLKDQTAAAEALAGYIAADATEPHQLAPALVDKLGARDAAHGALEWSQLSHDGSRALLGLFVEHHVREEAVAMAQDWPPADPDASTEEAREAANGSPRLVSAGRAAALTRMPLYESVQGSLVPLEPRRYLLPQRHPFFTPRTDEFLTPTAPAPVLSLLRALGVESLEDADVFEKFLLPAFGEASLERQEAMRRHLLANWQRLRQHDGVRAALSRTRFVPTAFGLLAPSELLDPRNNLLSYIFGGEDRFPAQQCSTEEWLAMLGALGMKTQVDRDAFLQCARKVEALGASTSDRPPPDVLSRAGLLATHLVDNLTTLAGAPADAAPVSSEELVDDAAASPAEAAAEADGLSAPDFCTALRGIRFVPSHAPVASLAPHEGPPTLASLEECALHTDRHLVWTVSPLLKEEWAPPRSLWARLGLVHPPPCDRVVSHAHNLSQFTADAWPWEGQPPEEVFGALWLYISRNPSLIGPEARKRLCELPTVLCGAALVKPSRIFRSCFPFCQPLMQPLSAVSLSPPPTPEVLLGMGMGEEPQLHDFVALLREVLREYTCVRLSPSERRALLGILEQATECRGFRPRADMAVPTVEGGVAPLSSSVINDAPDLLRRVRPGSLQAASPALSLEVRAALKVRRLSEAVREELSREASDLEPVELARAEELGLRIRGAGFARAAAALLASEAARRDPALQAAPQRLRPEAIVEALAPYRVVIVPRIQTRLRAVPSDEEVGVAGEGPSSAWFILPASTIFLEARPRCGTSHEELLSLAVLALLQTEPPATLAPLLSCAASDLDDALSLLRYAPPARFEAAASQCTPGTPVSAADEPLLQLKPLRPLFTAEVVAVDAPAPGSGRVYALVDGVGERGDARAAVNLRVGGGQTRAVLPLSVFSFRSLRLPLGDAVPLAEDASGPSHEAAGGEGAPAPAAAPGSGVGPGALVAAVESVLAQANVPLGLERKEMLARNLQLQEELKTSRRELQGALREAKAASDELGELKESNTCQICLSRRVDALLVGCGHLLCRQCVATITASGNNRCPFCRRDYEQVALFYAASPDGSGM